MRKRILLSSVSGALLAMLASYGSVANAQTAAALTGTVTSAEEGPMEGVIVSAKKDNSNITISVITDAQGKYAFPAAKLGAGHYNLSMRAVGYDLDGPKGTDISAGTTTNADLKLKKTHDLSQQLTNAEWMMSIPGSNDDKLNLINCVSCHTVQRIVRSTHDAAEFMQVANRMASYAQVSQPIKPQPRVDLSRASNPEQFRKLADYLATINLSKSDSWSYPLITMPRVKGRGTHVVITEYDLPRSTIEPHDVIAADGSVWYSNFGEEFLGKLNPATGQTSEFPLPKLKPGFPTGSLDLNPDKDGNLWMGMMYQAALAKFDPKTEKFQVFPVAPERDKNDTQLNMVSLHSEVDGKVWTNDAGSQNIMRLDVATGKYEDFDPLSSIPGGRSGHSIYDVAADSHDNVYLTEFSTNYLLKIDAKTSHVTTYQLPTAISRNRRGHMDSQDRFWFAEYRGNKIAMFDTKTEKAQEFSLPTKFTDPYDVVSDKNGDLWTGGMTTDRVVRLDPTTGTEIEYPLPRDTNMRRMFVDNSTTPPTFWVGSNHGASIVKVEPQD